MPGIVLGTFNTLWQHHLLIGNIMFFLTDEEIKAQGS